MPKLSSDYYVGSSVISTASLKHDTAMGVYRYAVKALPRGTQSTLEPYSVAVTCDTDDPESDDSLAFTAGKNADVVAGQTETASF